MLGLYVWAILLIFIGICLLPWWVVVVGIIITIIYLYIDIKYGKGI